MRFWLTVIVLLGVGAIGPTLYALYVGAVYWNLVGFDEGLAQFVTWFFIGLVPSGICGLLCSNQIAYYRDALFKRSRWIALGGPYED